MNLVRGLWNKEMKFQNHDKGAVLVQIADLLISQPRKQNQSSAVCRSARLDVYMCCPARMASSLRWATEWASDSTLSCLKSSRTMSFT